ncbi:MAG: hypothetical protein AAF909_14340 [Pseudomonadota bacterium]
MINLLLRRLGLGVVTVWLVSVIIFAGMEVLPGDACTVVLERDAQGDVLENCRKNLGLDKPAVQRYLDWAAGAAVGDFGVSADGTTKISTEVALRVKNSILLAAGALSVGVPLAILLGVIAGLARDQIFTGYAVATMTAMLLDGMALAWLPQLYGSTVEDAANAGAVILWGAGLGLVIAALLNGPADQKVSTGQAATS